MSVCCDSYGVPLDRYALNSEVTHCTLPSLNPASKCVYAFTLYSYCRLLSLNCDSKCAMAILKHDYKLLFQYHHCKCPSGSTSLGCESMARPILPWRCFPNRDALATELTARLTLPQHWGCTHKSQVRG